MKTAVLNIGDEVLLGQTINTNLALIANMLSDHGISISEQRTIKDDKATIIENFRDLYKRFDLVITSGGLGPTVDDITTECLAEAMGRELEFNQRVLEELEEYFRSSGRIMPPNNKKQAYFPQGSHIIKNDCGTASGYYLDVDNKYALVLPGPPREVRNIMEKFLANFSEKERLTIKIINTYGIGESHLENRLRGLELRNGYLVNTYIGKTGVDIKIVSEENNNDNLNSLVDLISKEFVDNVYDYDSVSMSKSLLNKLLEKNKKIAFAESCTGGNLAAEFTQNPGASNALICSLVTYTEEAKMKELGVKPETLEKFTAVSEETAREMLSGLSDKYQADYYAITTGYASPTGDKDTNGLVYIGVYDRVNNKTYIDKTYYTGSRSQIIEKVTNSVYFKLIKLLNLED